MADNVKKLLAICIFCGDDAPFTFKSKLSNKQVEIGSKDMYQPACRSCYLKKEQEKKKKTTILNKIPQPKIVKNSDT